MYAENWVYAPAIQKERELIEKTGAQTVILVRIMLCKHMLLMKKNSGIFMLLRRQKPNRDGLQFLQMRDGLTDISRTQGRRNSNYVSLIEVNL